MTFADFTLGSPKQIDWANSIRRGAFAEIEAKLAQHGIVPNEKQQAALDKLASIKDAVWWINNRSHDGIALAERARHVK